MSSLKMVSFLCLLVDPQRWCLDLQYGLIAAKLETSCQCLEQRSARARLLGILVDAQLRFQHKAIEGSAKRLRSLFRLICYGL